MQLMYQSSLKYTVRKKRTITLLKACRGMSLFICLYVDILTFIFSSVIYFITTYDPYRGANSVCYLN